MRSSLARRIFTTTLSIVIVGPLISGFTIHRTNSPDQTSLESVQLQVKDISRRPNDINDDKNEFTSKASTVSRTILRNEVGHLHEGSNVPEVPVADIKIPPNIEKAMAENVNDNKTTPPKLITPRDTEENGTVTSEILQITQPVKNSPIKEDGSNVTTELGITSIIDQTATDFATNANLSTGKDSTSLESKTDNTNYTSETTKDKVVSETTPQLTTPEEIIFTKDNVVSETTPQLTTPEKIGFTRDNVVSKTTPQLTTPEEIVFTKGNVVSETTPQLTTPEEIVFTKDNVVSKTAPQLTTPEKIVFRNSKTPEIEVPKEVSQVDDTTTVNISTSNNYDGEPIITTVPSWKKYVTIDRKRTSSEIITTEIVERDQKPSEIAEKIAEAPLKLSILLQNSNNITSTDTNLQDTTIETKNMDKERIVSSSDADDIRLTSISTIDTKRAGFLDLSKSSSSEPTTDKNTEMFEQQASISEAKTTKKPSVADTQSQLTEDAINEELLREEMIINREENTIRHQKVMEPDDGKQVMEVAPVSNEVNTMLTSTEDTLSVQPISQDRKTTLYTISPNYKPMKKIDVQPPKPFVRDPDDNSWRNESISSLGIVFKPKNATKSFKEVLKNKTETEFFNIPENKDSRNELPDLRVRLEKIAEDRKSKKKKTYKSGEVIYTDYEENSSGEASSATPTEQIDSMIFDLFNYNSSSLNTEPTMPLTKLETTTVKMSDDLFKKFDVDTVTTGKPKKYFNAAEYYDTTDEYDADYVTLSKIDLKKFTRPYPQHRTTTPPHANPLLTRYTTKPMSRPQFPERKPTIQYFPPRKTQNVNIDHYDDNFQKKVNYYSSKEKINPKDFFSFTMNEHIATDNPTTTPISQFKNTAYPSEKTTNDIYMTTQSRLSSPHGFVHNDENFNRGSYVIKHYKDFLNEAAKTSEFDKIPDFIYPDRPENVNGLTTSPPLDAGDIPPRKTTENDYDYETEFRKDVLHRFVENFNQNSERFKIDFPILYNNSIVHEKFDDSGRVSSSSAFMKRLYGNEVGTRPSPFSNPRKNCEPNCDNNMTVELSPAYELLYFVPEQEERASPVEAPATPPPFNFKL